MTLHKTDRSGRKIASWIHSLLGAVFALLLTHSAMSADSGLLEKIGARLAGQAVDQHFVQEKQLRVLKRPIRTEGVMLYRREQGVCWHTQKPVINTLVLGAQELRQINGADEQVLKAEQQPALFGFTRLFFAALSGQVHTLSEHFQLSVEGNEDRWQLNLTPRDALLRQFIETMQLQGGARIEQVRVTGKEGDTTRISFSPLAGADDIAQMERRCFVR